MLEEINFKYKVTKVNINKDEQFKPEFAKLSPFRKIPVIIDHENKQSLFEWGAILIYLGEKSGKFYDKRTHKYNSMVNGSNGLCWTHVGTTPSISSL